MSIYSPPADWCKLPTGAERLCRGQRDLATRMAELGDDGADIDDGD